MSIKETLDEIWERIDTAARKTGRTKEDISLVAVTKFVEADRINEAIRCGVKMIAENRVQELLRKENDVDKSAMWHIIGHLQTNKVKYIAGKVSLIQSVDSLKLAEEIDRQSQKLGIVSNVLIQINIAKEPQKYGVHEENLPQLLEGVSALNNIKVCGLMTIPPVVLQNDYNRVIFSRLRALYVDIKCKKYNNINMDILSMGMSNDYCEAIEEGANMVRIGSAIFRP